MKWTVSDSGEWIHLKRGIVPWRVWRNRSTWTSHHALWWVNLLVDIQKGLETKVGPRADLVGTLGICSLPTVALHVLLNSGVEAALMCLNPFKLPSERVSRLF
ncbi:hypothetical protein M9H77_05075 [Catharanthus roseus]|uniref:Uncharacterized protein n=1 Tax=Catharanthus roseus TaxID=4058 RepID=A0ACC0CG81_CATRO|nr:hypothetical protein M9H77_05075 [Catharanthus roseus]